jgi:hypothetical protein
MKLAIVKLAFGIYTEGDIYNLYEKLPQYDEEDPNDIIGSLVANGNIVFIDLPEDAIGNPLSVLDITYDSENDLYTASVNQTKLAEYENKIATRQELQEKIQLGKKARQCCQEVLDLVAGYNLTRELTAEQITQMTTDLAQPLQALQLNRPTTARTLLSVMTPDDVLTTQEMFDDVMAVFDKYGFTV